MKIDTPSTTRRASLGKSKDQSLFPLTQIKPHRLISVVIRHNYNFFHLHHLDTIIPKKSKF